MPTAVEVADLVDRWTPLALGLARKWGAYWPWLRDDFQSDAGVALWRLARKFSGQTPAEMVTFPGLVRKAVRWSVARRLEQERLRNPTAFHISTPADRDPDTGAFRDPLDLVADGREREPGAALEAADELAHALDRAELPARWRDVLVRCEGESEDLVSIADGLGVSRSRVGQMVRAARERVRAAGK